jgi:DNA-binding beta-propeller fold protein YncE
MLLARPHRSLYRITSSRIRSLRPAAVVLIVCCCLGTASGQWLDKTIPLADSFSGTYPTAIYYVPTSNSVYAVADDGVIVIDAATNAKVARLDLNSAAFLACDSRGNRVYLRSGRDSLVVVDPVTRQVVSRFQVGSYPRQPCYNPTANKVYCLTGYYNDTLTAVDCNTDSVLASIWVGRNYYSYSGTCCNPAGNRVYVTSYATRSIAVIDGASDSLLKSLIIGDHPVGPIYSPVSNKVYCGVLDENRVAVIDAGPDTLLKTIDVGASPLVLGYNPSDNKVYCGDDRGNVIIIDGQADTVLATLDLNTDDVSFILFDSVDDRVFCFPDYYTSIPVISGSGDSIVGLVDYHGDVYDPDPACYDPRQNRIYIRGRSSSDVGIVDAARMKSIAAIQMNPAPSSGCYLASSDKFYCSDEASGQIDVINCSSDSLEHRIYTPGADLGLPVYSSVSNKLYYYANVSNSDGILVVDCADDSFVAAIPLPSDTRVSMVYNSALDRIYWTGWMDDTTVVVIDCASDSVVGRVPVGRSPTVFTCNPDSNRVYCTTYNGDSAYISAIDCVGDSVIGSVAVHSGYYSWDYMCYVPTRDVVVGRGPGTSLVLVDGAARHVVGSVSLSSSPFGLYLSRDVDKLYSFLAGDDLAVIDCADWVLKAQLRLAADPADIAIDTIASHVYVTSGSGCVSLVDGRTNQFLGLLDAGVSPGDITWIPRHRKMYVVDQRGQAVIVFRDTSVAGIDGGSVLPQTRVMPTVVRGILNLQSAMCSLQSEIVLLSVDGRKVRDLQPGANDVRALAPGVYFVREAQASAQVVRKVVIAR